MFAHNGDLPGIYRSEALALGSYRPVGQTDSEHAFCVLLERVHEPWNACPPLTVEVRLSLLAEFAAELPKLGPANFVYSDGDALFAHGHRRMQFNSKRGDPPGLWTRQRRCAPADPVPDDRSGVSIAQEERSVVGIARVPLTDDGWRPLAEGEVVAVRDG